MTLKSKVKQEHWDASWEEVQPQRAPQNDIIRKYIEKYIPKASPKKNAIEIGCYPGRYLSVLAELGYEVNGIDLTPKLRLLAKWFQESGYKVGSFWREDFLKFRAKKKYDVVVSFGFLEHFIDWKGVLRKHCRLVKEGGLIFIAVPNFIGRFQNYFHRKFDLNNYKRHNIPSMDLKSWEAVFENENFSILYSGYFGNFCFWVGNEPRPLWQRIFLETMKFFMPLFAKLLPKNRKSTSPFGGIVANKNNF